MSSNVHFPDREACEEEETMGTTTLRVDDPFDDTSEADEQYELAPEDHPGGSSERPSFILNKGRMSNSLLSSTVHLLREQFWCIVLSVVLSF